MNSDDDSLAIAVKDILCPVCSKLFEDRLAKAQEPEEKDSGRQVKDIHQMEHEAQEKEIRIQESLSPEKRHECWLIVASVQSLAEIRARQAVSDWVEQGILYNILIAEAWKTAQSYNPAKSKFSTWVFRPWRSAIREFWRVKRLPTESLSRPVSDTDKLTTLQDQVNDQDTLSPDDSIALKELTDWANSTLDPQPLLKAMISDSCLQYEWLCVFCRKKIREHFQHEMFAPKEHLSSNEASIQHVYARRRLWINEA